MSEESATEIVILTDMRKEMRRELAEGKYTPLAAKLVDRVGQLIQKLTRKSTLPKAGYSALSVSIISVLITFFTAMIFGEHPIFSQSSTLIHLGIVRPIGILISLLTVKIISSITLNTLCTHLIDAMEAPKDLADLKRLLTDWGKIRLPLIISLGFAIVLTLFNIRAWRDSIFPFNTIFTVSWQISQWMTNISIGVGIIYLFQYMILPFRLAEYRFKLFQANPRRSEVISRLSNMMSNAIYLAALAGGIVVLTLSFSGTLNPSVGIFTVIIFWIPLTVAFVISQYSQKKIIINAKWKTLNVIQATIEDHLKDLNIDDKEKIEAINCLTDYHDRIVGTPDTAWDFQANLHFINSLLLPFFGFILGNYDKLLAMLL